LHPSQIHYRSGLRGLPRDSVEVLAEARSLEDAVQTTLARESVTHVAQASQRRPCTGAASLLMP
jgi:hypothetical protein